MDGLLSDLGRPRSAGLANRSKEVHVMPAIVSRQGGTIELDSHGQLQEPGDDHVKSIRAPVQGKAVGHQLGQEVTSRDPKCGPEPKGGTNCPGVHPRTIHRRRYRRRKRDRRSHRRRNLASLPRTREDPATIARHRQSDAAPSGSVGTRRWGIYVIKRGEHSVQVLRERYRRVEVKRRSGRYVRSKPRTTRGRDESRIGERH